MFPVEGGCDENRQGVNHANTVKPVGNRTYLPGCAGFTAPDLGQHCHRVRDTRVRHLIYADLDYRDLGCHHRVRENRLVAGHVLPVLVCLGILFLLGSPETETPLLLLKTVAPWLN